MRLAAVNLPREPISTDEIRDLVWQMFNMFRAIFCTDLCGVEAKNRATASGMRFLSHMESLDLKLNPKRLKPIWISKFNFLGLLRDCESFLQSNHVRNLYEGGMFGEGIVKLLRPLVAKGVHGRWATHLLLAHYQHSTLDILINATEDENIGHPNMCPLGKNIESSQFKRYTTAAEVVYRMSKGQPIPVLLYGSAEDWRAGAIIVAQNHWYFREIEFSAGVGVIDDKYGLTYHQARLVNEEICIGVVDGEFTESLGDMNLSFWDYAIIFPDLIHNDRLEYRYGIVRSSWQYLDKERRWSEHE